MIHCQLLAHKKNELSTPKSFRKWDLPAFTTKCLRVLTFTKMKLVYSHIYKHFNRQMPLLVVPLWPGVGEDASRITTVFQTAIKRTGLQALMSAPFWSRHSCTLSSAPARAARRKLPLASIYQQTAQITSSLSTRSQHTRTDGRTGRKQNPSGSPEGGWRRHNNSLTRICSPDCHNARDATSSSLVLNSYLVTQSFT